MEAKDKCLGLYTSFQIVQIISSVFQGKKRQLRIIYITHPILYGYYETMRGMQNK